MTWQRTTRRRFRCSAADLWSVIGDPRRWPQWCDAIGEVAMNEPVREGARLSYAPAVRWAAELHTRTAPPMRVTALEPGRRLAIEQPNPGGAMTVEWTIATDPYGADDGATLTQRVTAHGLLAPAVVRGVAQGLVSSWSESATRLHRLTGAAAADDPMTVVIAGGSGSLGRSLAADLTCLGHDVVVLTRHAAAALPYEQVEWDGVHPGAWTQTLSRAGRTGVVNLAGRLVDARPTAATISSLRSSRVFATRALVAASREAERPVESWVQGSTTAIWSDAGEQRVTETTPLPDGEAALPQMTGVAAPWEAAVAGADADHLVVLRTSIVLQAGSPALDRLAALTRAGLGGRVGSGRQWFSWIHVDDWLRIVRASLGIEPGVDLRGGVVIGAAPHPVRNAELMASLRRHLHRPKTPPTPALAVRVGSIGLRTDPALGLTGRHCTSDVLREAGLPFEHPTLDDALSDLLT